MVVALVAVMLTFSASIWYLRILSERKSCQEPPGPIPLPLLGDILTITKASLVPQQAFAILARKYGEIFKIRIGPVSAVVLGSAEAVKTVFGMKEGCGRDCRGVNYDRTMQKNLGLAFSNGKVYSTTRSWVIQTLQEVGFGKNDVESIINDEARSFLEKLEGSVEPAKLCRSHALNISWIMLTGEKPSKGDSRIEALLKASEEYENAKGMSMGALEAFPVLRFIFPEQLGYTAQIQSVQKIHQVAKEVLDEYRKVGTFKTSPSNFIEAYLKKAFENKDNPYNMWTEDHFKVLFADFFQGTFETTAKVLEAFLSNMSEYQSIQGNVRKEIDRVVGDNVNIGMDLYMKMPYTLATIMETHRHFAASLQQFSPHKALDNIVYKDVIIQKDTLLIPATEAINKDPKVFPYPERFRVENFLDENNCVKNLDKIFPFGIGRRKCPGQPTVELFLFIFIVTVLRVRVISKPDSRQKLGKSSSGSLPIIVELRNK